MKRTPTLLAALGLALVLFAWWGIETAAGRRRFDEMAGIIPFWAGIAGALLLAAALGAWLWRRR